MILPPEFAKVRDSSKHQIPCHHPPSGARPTGCPLRLYHLNFAILTRHSATSEFTKPRKSLHYLLAHPKQTCISLARLASLIRSSTSRLRYITTRPFSYSAGTTLRLHQKRPSSHSTRFEKAFSMIRSRCYHLASSL